MAPEQSKADELAEVIRAVRDRVRARHPVSAGAAPMALPDLMPLLHARDAAAGKVAAIGRVNPRPPGLANSIIQWWKRLIARALDWHVRDQIDFNRGVMECVQAMLDVLDENNRAMARVAAWSDEAQDVRSQWVTWRDALESKTRESEIYLLRSISELQHAFQARVTNMEAAFRKSVELQHSEYHKLLDEAARAIQERLWQDLDRIRLDYERLIHDELRTVRLRMVTSAGTEPAASPVEATPERLDSRIEIDWLKFADRFRGSEDRIRAMQSLYVAKFAGAQDVLDIGCGRGEFLEAAQQAGIQARGIDLNAECIALCRNKGLNAEVADLFEYLPALPDRVLGGVYCSQVIEHIPPDRLPSMIRLLGERVRPGAKVAFETPNPECLAIFASHFYLDPTHARPVPSSLLAFYLEEAGFGHIEVRQLTPAVESWPELAELPPAVRDRFFGGLDYALFATKL